jgi:hypothetical protein
MAQIKISLINSSSVLTDDQVRAAMPALQTQVSRDFAPVWGVDADLDFVPKGQSAPSRHWWLVVLDNSDQAGAMGYHDMTPQGLPLGKIFAATDMEYKSQWTVTASHELLEMLGDPSINLTALWMTAFDVGQNVVGRLYAYEVCDPCETDDDGYKIGDVLVSDFVYPSWFESFWQTGSTQFDYQKKITSPFRLLPGGYISVYDMTSGTGWQQISLPVPEPADGRSPRAPIGSRRERRRTPRNQWVRSDPQVHAGRATAAATWRFASSVAANSGGIDECPTQTLTAVTEWRWRAFVERANQHGFFIDSDGGQASQGGFSLSWQYDARTQALSLRCSSKPSWAPASSVNSRIRALLADPI